MTIDKHIYFSLEEYNTIKNYALNNKLSCSKAVCNLSKAALNKTNIVDRIDKLEKNIEYLIKKQQIILLLEEQIYSDMDFDNTTNPKNSKCLKEFNKKIRDKMMND